LYVGSLLKEKSINQVPVVEGKRAVGIVSDRDIRENPASPAGTLSVHELNCLLSEMTAGDIMTKNPVTVGPDTLAEAVPPRSKIKDHLSSVRPCCAVLVGSSFTLRKLW
jgi:CBS domain-containing protein